MRKILCILGIFTFVACSKPSDSDTPDYLVEDFFATYQEKSFNEALDKISQTNRLFTSSVLQNVKEQHLSAVSDIGKYQSYEIVSSQKVGESLILYSCMANYEVKPLRFRFTFYKPKTEWVLNKFEFDDAFIRELEEASKFYYIF